MKPTQKELNEFVLDLIEFMGKHFTDRFDKTRVAGGNEGLSIRIRKAESGSELEITTDNLDPRIDFGPAQWRYRELRDSRDALFERILGDLTAIFMDRIAVAEGFAGDRSLGGSVYRDMTDDAAASAYRAAHPGCGLVVLKRWTLPG
jgi:hypothetical protein